MDDDEKAFNEKRDEHKKVQREVQIHKREISEYQNGVIDYKRQMNTAKSDVRLQYNITYIHNIQHTCIHYIHAQYSTNMYNIKHAYKAKSDVRSQ